MIRVQISFSLFALVLAVGGCSNRAEEAKAQATQAHLLQIESALEEFKLNHKRYPAKLEDLRTRPSYVKAHDWPSGGYVRKPLKDEWGNKILYSLSGEKDKTWQLKSLGADGKEGGSGMDQDLLNPK